MTDEAIQKDATSTSSLLYSRLNRTAPVLVGLFSFIIYLRTMAPTIYWGDGIEFSTVCATGGVAHPTGYPLFTLLGMAFVKIFPQNPGFATNLMCGFFSAVASALFCIAVRSILNIIPSNRFLHEHYKSIIGMAAGLILAVS